MICIAGSVKIVVPDCPLCVELLLPPAHSPSSDCQVTGRQDNFAELRADWAFDACGVVCQGPPLLHSAFIVLQ